MVVAGNDWDHVLPGACAAPYQSGSARSEEPFVAPRDKDVAAQFRNCEILHAEAVHAIHAEERLILLGTIRVEARKFLRHTVDGHLHAGHRLQPGNGHDASPWRNRANYGVYQFVLGYGGAAIVERDGAYGSAHALGAEAEGILGNDVLLFGGQDF